MPSCAHLPSLPVLPTPPRLPAGAAARAPAAAHPGTPVGVGTPSLPQGKVVAETAGWQVGQQPPTIQPNPFLGIQLTPCTHRHLPSPALCPLALLSFAPCCLLPGVLPSLVSFPAAPLLCVTHLIHPAGSCCFLRALYPCPVPLLPASFADSHSLVLPPAGRGVPPLPCCSAKHAHPLPAVRHWVGCCAPLLSPHAHPGAPTFPSLTPSQDSRWCRAQALGAGC